MANNGDRGPRHEQRSTGRPSNARRASAQRSTAQRTSARRTPTEGNPRPGAGRRTRSGVPGKRRKGLLPTAQQFLTRLGNKLIRSPLVPIIGGLILLGLLLFGGLWLLTNKNAYDIAVNGEVVASIARNKDITDTWVYDYALAKLSADLGAKAQVEAEVTVTPAHRSRSKLSSEDFALGAVYKAFLATGYKLEAAEVWVNGIPIITLRNEAEAQSVFDQVMRSYLPVDVTCVEMGWVDDTVETKPRYVDASEIESAERAFAKLTFKTEAESIYQVRSGDSVWQICRVYGLTQDKLVELNPDVPEIQSGNLRAGQVIKIITPKPLCSVRTVEEITYPDVEKRHVEERPNTTQPKGWSKTIQEGSDGQCDVLAHVVRINGVEVERLVIDTTTTVSSVVQIVEVGTL